MLSWRRNQFSFWISLCIHQLLVAGNRYNDCGIFSAHRNHSIEDFTISSPTLEQVYFDLAKSQLRTWCGAETIGRTWTVRTDAFGHGKCSMPPTLSLALSVINRMVALAFCLLEMSFRSRLLTANCSRFMNWAKLREWVVMGNIWFRLILANVGWVNLFWATNEAPLIYAHRIES